MVLKDCKIFLDNPSHCYHPGQTLTGRVEYTLDAPKKVQGIHIKFKGFARTGWYETRFGLKREGPPIGRDVKYYAEEVYFAHKYYLIGSKHDELVIPEGEHVYPFTCDLPSDLPSSFEGEFGHTRYTIKVTLDRPWKFDQDTKMAFSVISQFDLNLNPDYKKPLHLHREKKFCYLCCQTGPLVIDVRLPQTGYCSGQTMPIDISCDNGSDMTVTCINLHFSKIATYYATDPFKDKWKREVLLAKVPLGSLMEYSSKTWQEFIQIPPLPPSNLMYCKIIDLVYEIRLSCKTTAIGKNVEVMGNVVLGTIPIAGSKLPLPPVKSSLDNPADRDHEGSALPSQQNSQEKGADITTPTAPLIDAPPSYQESQFSTSSIHDAGDSEHTRIVGDAKFAPKYPIYGLTTPIK